MTEPHPSPRRPRLAVVVPCFNTSASCAPVLAAARTVADAVIAIDDGSTDDTLQNIEASGCTVIRFDQNRGKGAALKAGLAEVVAGRAGALGQDFDFVITLDGDGQHEPGDVPRLVDRALSENADLVIGIRNVRLMPPKSKVGNYFSRGLFFLGTGRYVPDTQSGFRLFSVPLARALLDVVSWRRYETETEILSRAVALGFNVTTVEIPTIYFDENRRTHFDPLWDSMRVIAVLARYALSSLAVTAIDVSSFALLVSWFGLGVISANVGARVAAVAAHFLLSRAYAFRVQGRFRTVEVVRYGLTVVANLVFTTWLLLLLQRAGLSVVTAKIVAQTAGFALTFVVLERFVFKKGPSGRTDWEQYYVRPIPTAKWSRRIMEDELVRLVTAHAPRREPLRVLEIGGGNSCFLPRLMQEFRIAPYTLLDNSPEGIRLATERFSAQYPAQVRCVQADAFTATLDERFDVVFSVGLIEHFDDQQIRDLVARHARWAEDDGLVLIAVPTPTWAYRATRLFAELLGVWRFPDERPIERGRLVSLVRDAGLRPLSERTLWSQVLTQAIVAGTPAAGAATP